MVRKTPTLAGMVGFWLYLIVSRLHRLGRLKAPKARYIGLTTDMYGNFEIKF